MIGDLMEITIKINDIEFNCKGKYGDVENERKIFMETLPMLQEMKLGSRIAFVPASK